MEGIDRICISNYKYYKSVEEQNQSKNCYWVICRCLSFLLDCLISKNNASGFAFCKKLCESIKRTKDKQLPNSTMSNMVSRISLCRPALTKHLLCSRLNDCVELNF